MRDQKCLIMKRETKKGSIEQIIRYEVNKSELNDERQINLTILRASYKNVVHQINNKG